MNDIIRTKIKMTKIKTPFLRILNPKIYWNKTANKTYLCLYWDISISCSTGRNSRMPPIDISHLPSSSRDHVYPKFYIIFSHFPSYSLNVHISIFTISHHPYVYVLTIHLVYSHVHQAHVPLKPC